VDEAVIHVFYFVLLLSIFLIAQRPAINDQVVAGIIVQILSSKQSFPFITSSRLSNRLSGLLLRGKTLPALCSWMLVIRKKIYLLPFLFQAGVPIQVDVCGC
jgi:hypothetical protein